MTELEYKLKDSTNDIHRDVYQAIEPMLWRDLDNKLISPLMRLLYPVEVTIETNTNPNMSEFVLREFGKIK